MPANERRHGGPKRLGRRDSSLRPALFATGKERTKIYPVGRLTRKDDFVLRVGPKAKYCMVRAVRMDALALIGKDRGVASSIAYGSDRTVPLAHHPLGAADVGTLHLAEIAAPGLEQVFKVHALSAFDYLTFDA